MKALIFRISQHSSRIKNSEEISVLNSDIFLLNYARQRQLTNQWIKISGEQQLGKEAKWNDYLLMEHCAIFVPNAVGYTRRYRQKSH